MQLTTSAPRTRARSLPFCCRAPSPAPGREGQWAEPQVGGDGWEGRRWGRGGGGQRSAGGSYRGCSGGLARCPRAGGDGVGEFQLSAAAAAAAAVSVERTSASGTRDGAQR